MSYPVETTMETRKATIRLAMRDALHSTHPADLERSEAFTVLIQGIEMLDWEEITVDQEEAWLRGLLEAGWYLAPAIEQLPADLRRRLAEEQR